MTSFSALKNELSFSRPRGHVQTLQPALLFTFSFPNYIQCILGQKSSFTCSTPNIDRMREPHPAMHQPPQPSASEAERVEQLGPNASDLSKFSCLPCRQRKVKCDRRSPCSSCTKALRQCSFIDPVRGKRKKRSAPKEGLHAKLRRYEELLKSYGAEVEPSDNGNNNFSDAESVSEHDVQMADGDAESTKMSAGSPFTFDETKTRLISKNGSSRYFDTYVSSSVVSKLGF